nr:Thr-phospho decarboxylase [Lachnospiraceae bacterium]
MHGGDIYRNRIDLDFSVNINPLGPPREVQKILREGISFVDRYPDPHHERLREELAAFFGLHKEEVVPGNGVSELLMALCHALSPRV